MEAGKKVDLMGGAFPFLGGQAGVGGSAPPAPAPVLIPAVEKKPVRTIGNIYTAVQAQAIYNPGQMTPPDPSTGATQAGPIGNNPGNMTVKGPAGKQADQGVAGALQPETGWGKTIG